MISIPATVASACGNHRVLAHDKAPRRVVDLAAINDDGIRSSTDDHAGVVDISRTFRHDSIA